MFISAMDSLKSVCNDTLCDWINKAVTEFVKTNSKNINKDTLYEIKLFEIMSYIDPDSPQYIENFFDMGEGTKTYEDIKKSIHEVFCNKKFWKKYEEEEKKRIKALKETSVLEPNTDKKCRKCKLKKIYTIGVQSRSSDEATTQLYRCLNCGHFWKQN
jgi:DNA-directed RNA polymerase subunit M/transcription elongation factor TFIIS